MLAAPPALTLTMYIFLILLLVGIVVVVSIVSLVFPRNSPAPDPRIAILAQYEAGLMAHIRERYNCTDEETREVRRRFLEWEMDAADTGVEIGEDGNLFLSDDAVDTIDRYALKIGLRPAGKTEGHVQGADNRIDDDLPWLSLPEDLRDANAWDRYWDDQISHGLGPPIFDMFCNERSLIKAMSHHAIKRILCAGSGISLEPRVLAAAGFDVVALDVSPRALEIARAFPPNDRILTGYIDISALRPGGHLEYVVGDILDPAKSPGPFDMVIERRTAQNYQEPERDHVLTALAARLSPQGILFTHCHDGSWRPPAKPRHVTGDWCRAQGWPIWNGTGTKPEGRVAWLFTSTG